MHTRASASQGAKQCIPYTWFTLAILVVLQTSPLVEPHQRKEWEKFAWENKGSISFVCHILSSPVNRYGWTVVAHYCFILIFGRTRLDQ